ncbi:hypothetical protein K469DRAFT_703223, partial [Zopfia rhizophila CBS 207.26]
MSANSGPNRLPVKEVFTYMPGKDHSSFLAQYLQRLAAWNYLLSKGPDSLGFVSDNLFFWTKIHIRLIPPWYSISITVVLSDKFKFRWQMIRSCVFSNVRSDIRGSSPELCHSNLALRTQARRLHKTTRARSNATAGSHGWRRDHCDWAGCTGSVNSGALSCFL